MSFTLDSVCNSFGMCCDYLNCVCCEVTKPVQRTWEMLLVYRWRRPNTSCNISGEIKVDVIVSHAVYM